MQKLITSFLIAITITFLLGEIVKKKFEQKWYLTLTYEHIGRQLDINYMILNNSISAKTEQNFEFLVANLTQEIISRRTSNACSIVRGQQDNPNILIKFMQLNLEMSMVHNNKEMLEKCEKYLDDTVRKFNLINQQTIKTMFKEQDNPIIFENTDEVNRVLKEVVKSFERDGLEAFIENQSNAESKIKYATLMINLINSIENSNTDLISSITKMDFVKKTFREMKKREENIILMYFGLFIIIQSVMLIIFFINKKIINLLKYKSKNILNF